MAVPALFSVIPASRTGGLGAQAGGRRRDGAPNVPSAIGGAPRSCLELEGHGHDHP